MSVLQMGTSLKESKRRKMIDEEIKLLWWARSIALFLNSTCIPFWYIEGNERCKVIESAQHSSSIALIETMILLHTFSTKDVVYSIFWPWRPVNILWPSFDKGCSTRQLIFPQCFFFIFLIYVSLRKCQTELRFSQSKGAVSYKK